MTDQTVNVESIIAKYIELRDAEDKAKADYNAIVAPLKAAREGLEAYLMKLANDTGQTSFGCGAGTAFITTETHCGVADWNAVLEFVQAEGLWNMLTKSVSKTVVKEYLDAHEQLPPGINWTAMKAIQIRRGKK